MGNSRPTLYVGVTDSLERRVYEHKNAVNPAFTAKYQLKKLLYFEIYTDVLEALAREKELKGWKRRRKLELIKQKNPYFHDLSDFTTKSKNDSSDS